MKSPNEQIDNLFSKGLSNYEELPSNTAWDHLESQLPKRNRTFYWVAASAAMVFMVSAIAWNLILQNDTPQTYATNQSVVNANYPQQEFVPLPIIIHTTTVVYIEKEVIRHSSEQRVDIDQTLASTTNAKANKVITPLSNPYQFSTEIANSALPQPMELNTEFPITITYKKGDPKYPKLANTLNYFKEVSEGDRHLIDLGKITTGLIAKRESNNNSNN